MAAIPLQLTVVCPATSRRLPKNSFDVFVSATLAGGTFGKGMWRKEGCLPAPFALGDTIKATRQKRISRYGSCKLQQKIIHICLSCHLVVINAFMTPISRASMTTGLATEKDVTSGKSSDNCFFTKIVIPTLSQGVGGC